ncbi:MAG: peptide ABC transporter substrate-binding protein [Kofleriaceae bacterium]
MKWALLLLIACNPPDRGPRFHAAGSTTPRNGGTLRFAVKDQIRTIDPVIAYDEVSAYPVHAVYETLVDYEPAVRGDDASGLQLVPHLATRWEVSPDGLGYHFWLRDGITFSDGTPVVAGDFVYSLEHALKTPRSPFGPFLSDIAGSADVVANHAEHCSGITTPNDRELVIQLATPNMAFLEILAMSFTSPQQRKFVERVGANIQHESLGTGPFVVADWEQGRRIVLARNPRYWDASAIHLDQIEILENVRRDTQFLMFENGELDAAEKLSSPDYLWLIDQKAWAPYVQNRVLMNAYGSRMNVTKPPFDDRRVRQAMNYAVDKDHDVKLLNGAAVASHGILPPGMFGRDATIAPYPYDPAKARRLLAEAGYPFGFSTTYTIMADDEAERLAGSLQSDLEKVGIHIDVQVLSYATYVTTIGLKDHGADFAKATQLADFPDPTNFLDVRFASSAIQDENSNNDSFYSNPVLDTLLGAARGEPDRAKREAMYHRAERILYDDAPWIWEYHQAMTEVIQPYVAGYSVHPIWIRDYSRAWLDK